MSLWWVVPFLAAGAAILLWRLARPAHGLVVGHRGILQPGLGVGWIPWDEIEGAWPPTIGDADSVRLRLRRTERLARVLRKRRIAAEPANGRSVELRLDLTDSHLSAVDLLFEIQSRRDDGRAEAGTD